MPSPSRRRPKMQQTRHGEIDARLRIRRPSLLQRAERMRDLLASGDLKPAQRKFAEWAVAAYPLVHQEKQSAAASRLDADRLPFDEKG